MGSNLLYCGLIDYRTQLNFIQTALSYSLSKELFSTVRKAENKGNSTCGVRQMQPQAVRSSSKPVRERIFELKLESINEMRSNRGGQGIYIFAGGYKS